jgi:hypothetical protein
MDVGSVELQEILKKVVQFAALLDAVIPLAST